MAKYTNDPRVVLTLDAGGTNMVFSAMKGGKFIVDPITLPSNAADLDLCLGTMVTGFRTVVWKLKEDNEQPSAISFAFPGPADYPNGIIGGYLPNFPSFRDGVALGPYLSNEFGVPVYINNDGDLYAYGEALGGLLPEINEKLELAGSSKRYRNLIGYTFGTGLGIGTVINGELNRGDNSCVETFCLPHSDNHDIIVEDGASIRAVKRVYRQLSGDESTLEPKDIFDIAEGTRAAKKYIMPSLLEELRSKMHTLAGEELNRVQMKVYDLDNDAEFEEFAKGDQRKLKVYGSDREVVYDPQKRIGVAISKLGASKAISLGAYAFALNQLDKNK